MPVLPMPSSPEADRRQPAIAETVAEVVTTYMATLTSERIDHDRPLFDAGLDSLGTLELIEQFEQRFSLTGAAHSPVRPPDDPRACGILRLTGALLRQWRLPLSNPPRDRRATEHASSLSRPAIGHLARCAFAAGCGSRHQAGVLALSIVPLLVLFDLSAGWLTTYQLLLTGPLWLALVPLTTMAVVL